MTVRLLILALAALPVGAPALAEESPEAFVRAIYAHYREGGSGIRTSGSQGARYYHPSLLALFKRDRDAAKGEVGALGADPICSCQDYDIRSVSPSVRPERDGVTPVTVRFRNFGGPSEVELRLVRTPAGWRIFDVATDEVPSLRTMIEAHLKAFPG